MEQALRTETPAATVPGRLRRTADILDVATNAIAIIAYAQGLDYPTDRHREAQQELRAWARYLDECPSIAADFERASTAGPRNVPAPGGHEDPTDNEGCAFHLAIFQVPAR